MLFGVQLAPLGSGEHIGPENRLFLRLQSELVAVR